MWAYNYARVCVCVNVYRVLQTLYTPEEVLVTPFGASPSSPIEVLFVLWSNDGLESFNVLPDDVRPRCGGVGGRGGVVVIWE